MLAVLIPLAAAAALLAPAAAAPAPAAMLFHSPHDVIEAWAISPDFEHDGTLFVGLPRFSFLLRSRDGGATFESAAAGLYSAYVLQLAISPDFAKDRTLWCSEAHGLYVTHDAGESWAPMTVPAAAREAATLVPSPGFATDGTLALGTRRDGLWISRDRGATWTQATLPAAEHGKSPGSVTPVAFSPAFAQDGVLMALVGGATLLRSSDGGRTLSAVTVPEGTVRALIMGERGAGGASDGAERGVSAWVGTAGNGVWRSDDGGASWQREGEETDRLDVLGLARSQGPDGGVLFASTVADGVRSKPDGGAWSGNPEGFRDMTHQTQQHYTAVIPSPAFARDRTVFAATYEGLYVSRTGGDGWQWLNVLHPQMVRNVWMSSRFAEDGTMWFSTYGAGLLETADGGKTFRVLDTAEWMFPDGIAASPDYASDHTVFVGTPNRLLVSTDGGKTSQSALPGARGFARLLATAPDFGRSGRAFAHLANETASKDRFVRRSVDGTWADTGLHTVEDVAFAPDWDASGCMWAACPEGLMRSDDGGASFHRVDALDAQGLTGVSVAPGAPGSADGADGSAAGPSLMAATRGAGVFLSTDGGASWTALTVGGPTVRPWSVRLSPDFARDGTAFAGPLNDALFVTRDGGATWARATGGPRIALELQVSPTYSQDHALVVGSYEGPWISRDAGRTWTRPEIPVPAEPAMSQESAALNAGGPPR